VSPEYLVLIMTGSVFPTRVAKSATCVRRAGGAPAGVGRFDPLL